MKKIKFLLVLLIPLFLFTSYSGTKNIEHVYAQSNKVYLGGYPVGITLNTTGAEVVGLCDVVRGEEISSPSKDAGIMVGDVILTIDEKQVNTADDIANVIKDGNPKILEILREDNVIVLNVKPRKDNCGEYKLGLFVRNGTSGIGTVTYFTTQRIACLGHPILGNNNEILTACDGRIYECNINSVIKGVRGRPGELRGTVDAKNEFARVKENKYNGVFGQLEDFLAFPLIEVEIGTPQMGNASIYTTIKGNKPKKYDISIIKYDKTKSDKNMVIKITDKELLEVTNGIVQGMSGSPIVQNGRIVGAVTHVFVNDQTRGFGISIENMY